jgi:hypothetical protein
MQFIKWVGLGFAVAPISGRVARPYRVAGCKAACRPRSFSARPRRREPLQYRLSSRAMNYLGDHPLGL